MKTRYIRNAQNFIPKISSRGPVCLVACRDARLALTLAKALEDHHYPLVLVPSASGLGLPFLMNPEVVVLDEKMLLELQAIGHRKTVDALARKPTILLGTMPANGDNWDLLRPLLSLPLTASSSEIVQTIQALAQAEAAEGRQVLISANPQGFPPSAPVPAAS